MDRDGTLYLGPCDLVADHPEPEMAKNPCVWHFSQEAQIAAAYANAAGYRVGFYRYPDKPIYRNDIGGHFLRRRPIRKDGWPKLTRKKKT